MTGSRYRFSPSAYQAFEWSLFLAQETSPQTLNGVWSRLNEVTDARQALTKLDSALLFATHFRDFAARDIDDPAFDFHDQGSSDIAPHFQDAPQDPSPWLPSQEPASFAAAKAHPFAVPQTHHVRRTTKVTAPASLSASYFHAQLDATHTYASFDFSSLPQTDQIDALVRVAGQVDYERGRLTDHKLSLCRHNTADDISSVVFVISNPSLDTRPAKHADLGYTTDTDCTSISGSLTFAASGTERDHFDDAGTTDDRDADYTNSGTVDIDFPGPNLDTNASSSTLDGNESFTWHRASEDDDATYRATENWNGSLTGDDAVTAVFSHDSDNVPIAVVQVDMRALGHASGTHTGDPDDFHDCTDDFHLRWGSETFEVPLDAHGDGTLTLPNRTGTIDGPTGDSICTEDADFTTNPDSSFTYGVTGTIHVTGAQE